MLKKQNILLLLLLIWANSTFAQISLEKEVAHIEKYFSFYKFDKVVPYINSLAVQSNDKHKLENLYKSKYFLKVEKPDSAKTYLNKYNPNLPDNKLLNAVFYNVSGLMASSYNNDSLAAEHYLKSAELSKQFPSKTLYCDALFNLLNILSNFDESTEYLNDLEKIGKEQNNHNILAKVTLFKGNRSIAEGNFLEAVEIYEQASEFAAKAGNNLLNARISVNMGVISTEYLDQYKKGREYYKKSVEAFKEGESKENKEFFTLYKNIATSYYYEEDFKNALKWCWIADSLKLNNRRLELKSDLHWLIADIYDEQGLSKQALKHYKLRWSFADSLKSENQQKAVKELETKYRTELKEKEIVRLEKENLIVKAKRRNNLYLFLLIAVALCTVSIVSLLALKNRKKKLVIARQNELIEKQKVKELLKEQEIREIDSMIAGQEKERKRIADDLHDNLGSMLATLKLHFDNLKRRKKTIVEKENQLFEHTDELLEEAYQKVRSIAHEKNSGVIANQGLVAALKNMANKISSANQVKIEVVAFGMDQRLDNSLEIGMFRIIQELTANIIKHAAATLATIELTNHEKKINLIVEDNGNGFSPENIDTTEGMGLKNIQTRVEHLGGDFTIDSEKERGTTIIIDIPL